MYICKSYNLLYECMWPHFDINQIKNNAYLWANSYVITEHPYVFCISQPTTCLAFLHKKRISFVNHIGTFRTETVLLEISIQGCSYSRKGDKHHLLPAFLLHAAPGIHPVRHGHARLFTNLKTMKTASSTTTRLFTSSGLPTSTLSKLLSQSWDLGAEQIRKTSLDFNMLPNQNSVIFIFELTKRCLHYLFFHVLI